MSDKMAEGRELDVLIAKQVFGRRLSQWWCEHLTTYEWMPVWEEGRGEMQPILLRYEDSDELLAKLDAVIGQGQEAGQ